MKKLHLLPLFTLFACASSSQYERGAYMPPPSAPAFNPATDAPHTTGQPGYVNGQRADRSPNHRYVTPSKEPQMMAADGDDRRAVELMFSEPVPDETPDGIEGKEYAKCWKDIQRMLKDNRDATLTFSPEEVRCVRHKTLAHCGARQIERRTKEAGDEYDGKYEDFMASRDQRVKACGKRDKYNTERVVNMGNRLMDRGDDDLGWRP